MNIWSNAAKSDTSSRDHPPSSKHSKINKDHPMDILIKDDKRTKPAPKKGKAGKCIHIWKELDQGRVHKPSGGHSYNKFQCTECNTIQRRNISKKKQKRNIT